MWNLIYPYQRISGSSNKRIKAWENWVQSILRQQNYLTELPHPLHHEFFFIPPHSRTFRWITSFEVLSIAFPICYSLHNIPGKRKVIFLLLGENKLRKVETKPLKMTKFHPIMKTLNVWKQLWFVSNAEETLFLYKKSTVKLP